MEEILVSNIGLVFDQSSPVHPVSESWGVGLSVMEEKHGWKSLCLILDEC